MELDVFDFPQLTDMASFFDGASGGIDIAHDVTIETLSLPKLSVLGSLTLNFCTIGSLELPSLTSLGIINVIKVKKLANVSLPLLKVDTPLGDYWFSYVPSLQSVSMPRLEIISARLIIQSKNDFFLPVPLSHTRDRPQTRGICACWS